MTKIVSKELPNSVSAVDVTDSIVRQKVILLQENIVSLKKQISELQNAVIEVQRCCGSATRVDTTDSVKLYCGTITCDFYRHDYEIEDIPSYDGYRASCIVSQAANDDGYGIDFYDQARTKVFAKKRSSGAEDSATLAFYVFYSLNQ